MSKIPGVTVGIDYTLILLQNDNKPSLMIITFRVDS